MDKQVRSGHVHTQYIARTCGKRFSQTALHHALATSKQNLNTRMLLIRWTAGPTTIVGAGACTKTTSAAFQRASLAAQADH